MGIVDNTSNQYHVRLYRKPETQEAEDLLDAFVDFIYHDSENEPTKGELAKVKAWAAEYVGYRIDKVARGEAEMLKKWTAANG